MITVPSGQAGEGVGRITANGKSPGKCRMGVIWVRDSG